MKKSVKTVKLGSGQSRYQVQIFGEPCPEFGPESTIRKLQMLQMVCDRPDVGSCGPAPFQKLKLYYGGSEWVLELEAVGDDITGGDDAPARS